MERLRDFLDWVRPDVIHLHHFFTFGIEIIPLIREYNPNIRIVLTFHEYLAICFADGQMRRRTDQSLCYEASGWRCHQCFPDIGPEMFFMRKTYFHNCFDMIDAFITPTNFVRDRYIKWGISEDKLHVVSNPDTGEPDPLPFPRFGGSSSNLDDRIITFGFFGQLVDNKGVDVLISAARMLWSRGAGRFRVLIHGGNEQYASEEMRRLLDEVRQSAPNQGPEIQLVGGYDEHQLRSLMARVDAVVVPSTWWEVFCLVVTEAWRFGRPVVCSAIGGLGERVRDGYGGLTFPANDAPALADTLELLIDNPALLTELRETIPRVPDLAAVVNQHLHFYDDDEPT